MKPAGPGSGDWRTKLNEFKDREMFRIDMRHILGQTSGFDRFSAELTDLAEVVVGAAVGQVERELQRQHGCPRDEEGRAARLVVAALGKGGGRELGFASDIELMFVFAAGDVSGRPGETDGRGLSSRPSTSTSWSWKRHAPSMRGAKASSRSTCNFARMAKRAASPFRWTHSAAISPRADPHGRTNARRWSSCAPLRAIWPWAASWRRYATSSFTPVRDSTWRPCARCRERQLRHLAEPGRINAKFSKGGLVDLEYIVQGLQMAHGHREPALRVTNTAAAIAALAAAGIVSGENAARLADALTFLQQLINALRMVRGNSKDLTVPPVESEEFAFLARRLGYGSEAERLSVAINETMGWVQRLEGRLLG